MQELIQSDPRAAYRRVYFTCVDLADRFTDLQASDMNASWTIKLSKNGGAWATPTNVLPVEIGSADGKGGFYLELGATDLDTAGFGWLRVSNTGGTKTMFHRDVLFRVDRAAFAVAQAGTLTSVAFSSNRTDTRADCWQNNLLECVQGVNLGQTRRIGGYTVAGGIFTLLAGQTFGDVVQVNDIFRIISH